MRGPWSGPAGVDRVEPQRIREQLARILASPEFVNASRLRDLLTYIVEETLAGDATLKETAIAMRVFHRRASFDSSGDSVVRVAAHNLRNRLQDYYLNAGLRDPIRIEVPKGSYVPLFHPQPGISPAGPWRRRALLAAALAVLAVLAAIAWWARGLTLHPIPSLAVLPFADFGDPQTTLLCEGLTEDLTTDLARLPKLRVIARTSATQFRPQGGDVRVIGARLGASAILEGSIRRDGSLFRFSAQLIDAHSRYHIWSESYERDARDPLAAEVEVGRLVASAVARRLGAGGLPARSAVHVPTAEAYDLFWKARYLRAQKLDPDAWRKARDLLEAAVRADPQYAAAWAEWSTLAATMAFHGMADFDQLAAQAKGAAAQALALDDGNPDAQTALAELEWLQDRNWPAADRRFRRILAATPSLASAHGMFAVALMSRGRFDEALAELDRSAALNPLPYVVSNDRPVALYLARRYRQSIARARQVLAVDPGFWYAHLAIGSCLAAQGRYQDAIREFRQTPPQDQSSVEGRLGHALALSGQRAEALEMLQDLRKTASGDSRVHSAFIQVALGDKPGALDSLDQAFLNHETDLNYIAVEPVFDPLRREPRFNALLKRLGL